MAFIAILCALLVACASADQPEFTTYLREKKHGRRLISCDGFFQSCENNAHVCRKVNAEATAKECVVPAKKGEFCEKTDNCDATTLCEDQKFENGKAMPKKCKDLNVLGDKCMPLETKSCAAGLVCLGNTAIGEVSSCKKLAKAGDTCKNDNECEGFCNTKAGVSKCKAYTGKGQMCESDKECGENNVVGKHFHCDSGTQSCAELGEQIGEAAEGFFAALGAALIGIIVGIVLIIALLIWCCCCRKKNTVVVVQ